MFSTFAGMISLASNSKVINFVKTDENITKLLTSLFLHKVEKQRVELNKLEKKFTGEEKKTNSPENKLQ